MRIALVLGVSEYRRADSLPACKRDADAIESLLNQTNHFEHRLHLSGELLAQDTKTRILSFLDSVRGQRVSQALFYFSGHGTIQDGGLLYLLSDFDEARPHQTSIENEEVDNWLRDLAPEVAVKITDCCNSGMSYVKDAANIESAVARSKGQFSACYFLAASHADEVTYAGEGFSDFTDHILRGLCERELGAIRYKDLADIVLDGYKDNESQRPYIVQQGGMRDIFFEQTEETLVLLKKFVVPRVSSLQPSPTSEEEIPVRRSLVEVIEADAKGMITREAASSCLMTLQRSVETFQVDDDIKDIYELKSEFLSAWEARVANEKAIGKWINRYGNELFAESVEEDVKTRVPYHLLDPMDASMNPWGKIESNKEITGFVATANLEYDFVKLVLDPKYSNLDRYEASFLLLWSMRDAVLFRYFTSLRAINWSEHQAPGRIGWKVIRFSATEISKIDKTVADTFRKMEKLAKDKVVQRFQPKMESN